MCYKSRKTYETGMSTSKHVNNEIYDLVLHLPKPFSIPKTRIQLYLTKKVSIGTYH